MGMIFKARMVSEQQVIEAQSSPDGLGQLLYDKPDDPSRVVDADKAWHAIHFLLTGSGDFLAPGEPPRKRLFRRAGPAVGAEGLAVFGGEDVGEGSSYADARMLRSEQVAEVATALVPIDRETLAERVDLPAMTKAELYPQIWDEPDVYDEYLGPNYEALRDFYLRAAAERAAVLLSIE